MKLSLNYLLAAVVGLGLLLAIKVHQYETFKDDVREAIACYEQTTINTEVKHRQDVMMYRWVIDQLSARLIKEGVSAKEQEEMLKGALKNMPVTPKKKDKG